MVIKTPEPEHDRINMCALGQVPEQRCQAELNNVFMSRLINRDQDVPMSASTVSLVSDVLDEPIETDCETLA